MTENESFQRASAAAIRFIAYRPRSEAEVRQRLRKRFPPDLVERVLSELVERSVIDDVGFARLWRNSRESLNPRSAGVVRRELWAKGVSKETAQEAVSDLDDSDGALRAGRKFARRLENADYSTYRRRLWGHLQRRGFGQSVVRRTIEVLWVELHGGEGSQETDES